MLAVALAFTESTTHFTFHCLIGLIYRSIDLAVLAQLQNSEAPPARVRAFTLKLARNSIGIGSNLDIGRKQVKTLLQELTDYVSTIDTSTTTILTDVHMENWTNEAYHELLGTELGNEVLALVSDSQASTAQEAAVLDEVEVAPPVPLPPTMAQPGSQQADAPALVVVPTQVQAPPLPPVPALTQQATLAAVSTATSTRCQTTANMAPTVVAPAIAAAAPDNTGMPAPPPRPVPEDQDDHTEMQEFLALQEDQHQVSAHELGAELLAALNRAKAHGVDIDRTINVFAEQSREVSQHTAAVTVPPQDPMGIPIPKRRRQTHQLPMRIQGPEKQVPPAGTNYFRTMFPTESTAGGVPLPGSHHAQGFAAPYDVTGLADNIQMSEHSIAGKPF